MQYTHPDIQNDLIASVPQVVLNVVKAQFHEAKYWAVMADKVRDCSCKEQMAICIQYYYSSMLHKRCISIAEVDQLDALSLNSTGA